jgi:hypothetical protein
MTAPQLPNASAPLPVETLHYFNPAASAVPAPAWRTGNTLVLSKEAVLPERCVKCNVPTDRRFRRRMTWYPWYLLILFIAPYGPLILLVLYLVLRRTMRVDLGVCPRHLRLRRALIAAAFVTLLAAIYALVYSVGHQSKIALLLFGLLSILSATIASSARILRPTQIDDHNGYFRGASPDFLDSLPGIANPPR